MPTDIQGNPNMRRGAPIDEPASRRLLSNPTGHI